MPFDLPIRLHCEGPLSRRYGARENLFLALLAPIASARKFAPAATAQGDPDLNGLWKLVAQSSGDQEWIIFEIKQSGGKSTIEMIDGPKNFPKPQVYLAKTPEALVVLFAFELGDMTFKAPLQKRGADGRINGAWQFRTTGHAWTSGARLEKTRATKVAEPSEPPEKPGAMAAVGLLLEMRKATAEFLDDRYKSLELTTAAAAAASIPIDASTTVRAWAVTRLVDAAKRAPARPTPRPSPNWPSSRRAQSPRRTASRQCRSSSIRPPVATTRKQAESSW